MLLGLDGVTLSLGNTSIFNALCDSANLDVKEASKLRDILGESQSQI